MARMGRKNKTRRRRVGAMTSTTETMLLVGGALVVGYMLMRPKTPTMPTTVYVPVNSGGGNQTSQDITAAGGALSQIFGSIFG